MVASYKISFNDNTYNKWNDKKTKMLFVMFLIIIYN